jgi:outer membrane protein TolC
MEGHCTMRILRFCALVSLALSVAVRADAQESTPPVPAGQSNPLLESVPAGPPSSAVVSLSLREVIDRALRANLATILGSEDQQIAAARRLQDLAELYPKIEAVLAGEERQVNLAAFGFTGFPGVNQVIGPFPLVDARAVFSQSILDLERRHNLRESTESERAAALNNSNTRELVVLTVVDLYFQVVSSQSRVTAAEAQLARARVLRDRAVDLRNAGTAPGIDVLRAEVEQRSAEQRLIQAQNLVQKQKLALAHAIGLPLAQQFTLSDSLPKESPVELAMDELLGQALGRRSDAMAIEARIRAAEEDVKATRARSLPALNFLGDYGVTGSRPTSSHGSFSLRVEMRVPVFDRGISSDAFEKEAVLRQRKAERDSLRARIELEVRAALLDLQSTAEQLRVSRQSLDLAQQQLDQAQDRFSAGVANNLEVVQAQEAVALADEGVIQSLYGFNISRALLARATGSAERSIPEFFPGGLSR